MVFKNDAQLKKFLMGKCAKAVADAEKEVYEKFDDSLNQFYAEFKPREYIRTGALLDSLEHTGVKQVGNQHMSRAEAEVYFNTPVYEHGWVLLQSGEYDYSSWSDEKVLDVVMKSGLPHGGYEGGTAIWNETMKNLGGNRGIRSLLKQKLKEQGL